VKFVGSYKDLKTKLTPLNGAWAEPYVNKKSFKLGDGRLDWFPTTGTILFMGKGEGRALLERVVPALLYPGEFC
jgi:hypothetical protein